MASTQPDRPPSRVPQPRVSRPTAVAIAGLGSPFAIKKLANRGVQKKRVAPKRRPPPSQRCAPQTAPQILGDGSRTPRLVKKAAQRPRAARAVARRRSRRARARGIARPSYDLSQSPKTNLPSTDDGMKRANHDEASTKSPTTAEDHADKNSWPDDDFRNEGEKEGEHMNKTDMRKE